MSAYSFVDSISENVEILTDVLRTYISEGLRWQLNYGSKGGGNDEELRTMAKYILLNFIFDEEQQKDTYIEEKLRKRVEEQLDIYKNADKWITPGIIDQKASICSESIIDILISMQQRASLGVQKRKRINKDGSGEFIKKNEPVANNRKCLNTWLLPVGEKRYVFFDSIRECGILLNRLQSILKDFGTTLIEKRLSFLNTGLYLHPTDTFEKSNYSTVEFELHETPYLNECLGKEKNSDTEEHCTVHRDIARGKKK